MFLIPTKGIFLVVVAPGTKITKEIPLKPLLCKGFFISEIWGADHSADHRGIISIQKMWYLLLQQTCALPILSYLYKSLLFSYVTFNNFQKMWIIQIWIINSWYVLPKWLLQSKIIYYWLHVGDTVDTVKKATVSTVECLTARWMMTILQTTEILIDLTGCFCYNDFHT